MLEMVFGIATRNWDGWRRCVDSWYENAAEVHPWITAPNMDVLPAFDAIHRCTTEPIIAYIHDDVVISEPGWDNRVLREFDDPAVGLVGFGGATGHGHPQMYKIPYMIPQLARIGFRSNMKDAERHGARFVGECDVAVLDGFALFVRRELLDKIGGWPLDSPIGYFGYDYWACCMARRHGYRIRLVGVACDHLGGKSSGLNPTANLDYEGAHQYIYDEFEDVLPARVVEG